MRGAMCQKEGGYMSKLEHRGLLGGATCQNLKEKILFPHPLTYFLPVFYEFFFYIKQCDFHQHFLFFDVLSKKTSSPSKMTLKFEGVRFFAIDIVFF